MDFREIEREARYKVESLMGLFSFLESQFDELKIKLNEEARKVTILQDVLLDVRQELRKKADYQLADTIRDALKKVGVIIEDTKN